MNLIVADTGPLNYLALIGEIELLPNLCESVVIPDAVWRELQHAETPRVVQEWIQSGPAWLKISAPARSLTLPALQLGESQAISLAVELRAPILVDDADARHEAKNRKLRVLGTIGLLELGALAGFINLEKALSALQQTNHRNTPELIEAALERFRRHSSAS